MPEGYTPTSYLRERVEEGIKIRFPEGITSEIRQTIEKELRLIAEQEYEYFFLTIYDIVQFAKQQKQPVRIRCAGHSFSGFSMGNGLIIDVRELTEVKVDQDPAKKEEMLAKSNGRRTVPQIFINEQSVGGCDDLYALEESGQLDKLL